MNNGMYNNSSDKEQHYFYVSHDHHHTITIELKWHFDASKLMVWEWWSKPFIAFHSKKFSRRTGFGKFSIENREFWNEMKTLSNNQNIFGSGVSDIPGRFSELKNVGKANVEEMLAQSLGAPRDEEKPPPPISRWKLIICIRLQYFLRNGSEEIENE